RARALQSRSGALATRAVGRGAGFPPCGDPARSDGGGTALRLGETTSGTGSHNGGGNELREGSRGEPELAGSPSGTVSFARGREQLVQGNSGPSTRARDVEEPRRLTLHFPFQTSHLVPGFVTSQREGGARTGPASRQTRGEGRPSLVRARSRVVPSQELGA